MIKVCMVGVFNYASDARVKGYAESLDQAGYQVDVLCLHGSVRSPAPQCNGIRVFNIPIHRASRGRIQYLLAYSFSFLLLNLLLVKMFFKERYEIIHVHNMPDLLVFIGLIPKLLRARIILDIHDLMPEVYVSKFPNARSGLGGWFIRRAENLSIKFADAVITANSHFRTKLVFRGVPAHKITVVNNYPAPHIFNRLKYSARRQNKSQEGFVLIFPGTIAPRYGLEVAIRALPLIQCKLHEIKLLIIGRQNEHVASLASLAKQLGVSSLVEFRPPVPNEAIPELLSQADVGIYPALPDAHMSIAIPGKLLEFAVMGLPILSSRLQIVEELFDESAIMFFEPGNATQFAHCVLKLYENPVFREQLVRNADRTFVANHSWQQEFDAYVGLLDSLFEKSKREVIL